MISKQGNAQRPEVHIMTWKNEEMTTDSLPVHGYENYLAKDYVLAHAPFTGIESPFYTAQYMNFFNHFNRFYLLCKKISHRKQLCWRSVG